jgi:hypothetical protein
MGQGAVLIREAVGYLCCPNSLTIGKMYIHYNSKLTQPNSLNQTHSTKLTQPNAGASKNGFNLAA